MTTQRKTRLMAWGLVISVFTLGCVTGASLDGVFRLRSETEHSLSLRNGEVYFEKLKRDLALDAEQASGIRRILEEARSDYGAVCAEVRPRYDALRDRTRTAIRAQLTPSQQGRFDLMVAHDDCGSCPDRRP